MDELQQRIDYRFKDISLLETALTHSSYAMGADVKDNERLEFFGDAVLELCMSEYLFLHYPKLDEGGLTRLRAQSVCENALYTVALSIGIGDKLRLSRGEEQTGGRNKPSILSDAVEALIAAIYIDGGLSSAMKFVERFAPELIEHALNGRTKDSKTRLQEFLQKQGAVRIDYYVVSQTGPEHHKEFESCVAVGEKILGKGKGKSKKDSEQAAAREALNMLGAGKAI